MDESKIQLFIGILGHKSLRRAAEEAYMTEPTLNNRLKKLETELGVTLIKRTPRGFKLTPEGEVFAVLAPKLLGTLQDIRYALSPPTEPEELCIAATPHLASLILPQFIAQLRRIKHVELTGVTICQPPELLQGLETGRFQIGLIHTVGELPNIKSLKLFEDRLTLISGEPLSNVTVEQISQWEIFAPVKDYLAWKLIDSFFHEYNVTPKKLIHVNHPILITQIVKNHPGFRGIVAEGMLSNVKLKESRSPYPITINGVQMPSLPTYIVWREDEKCSKTRDFVNLLYEFVVTKRKNTIPANDLRNAQELSSRQNGTSQSLTVKAKYR